MYLSIGRIAVFSTAISISQTAVICLRPHAPVLLAVILSTFALNLWNFLFPFTLPSLKIGTKYCSPSELVYVLVLFCFLICILQDLSAYLDYMTNVGFLLGGQKESTRKHMTKVLQLETQLSKVCLFKIRNDIAVHCQVLSLQF